MRNLFTFEKHIRMISGMMILSYGAYTQVWWIAIIGIFLIYTGGAGYCPIFRILGINKLKLKHNYHLSLLPEHNPEPVFLFNKHGDLVFRNKAARNILPKLRSLIAMQQESQRTGFHNQVEQNISGFAESGKSYLLRYQTILDSDLIAAFAFNVTDLINANEEIVSTQKELLYRMGEIGETRSMETGNHVKRVAEYSRQLALLIGLPKEEAELLKMASPMHDIGKVAIPDTVLLKPGKLDADEWEIMKTHATIGYELLRHSDRPILKAAAIVSGQHHEKWDGSGYPNGYAGEEIHIYGRITAVADVFDALASERVYKKAWPLDKILELLKDQKERHFDPQLVDLLLDNLDRFLTIRDQFQDKPMTTGGDQASPIALATR